MYQPDLKKEKPNKTREKLLRAAIAVMSEAGIAKATTREIAKVAGVNEVTLFRHFQTKEQLLRSVAQHISRNQKEALSRIEEFTGNLREDLLYFARIYDSTLEEHQALVRNFIGEAKRHPQEALCFLQEGVIPLRNKLIDYLLSHKTQEHLPPNLDLPLAVDLFTGMLLIGILRRHIPLIRDYSRDRYVESCVDLFIQGLNPCQTLGTSLQDNNPQTNDPQTTEPRLEARQSNNIQLNQQESRALFPDERREECA